MSIIIGCFGKDYGIKRVERWCCHKKKESFDTLTQLCITLAVDNNNPVVISENTIGIEDKLVYVDEFEVYNVIRGLNIPESDLFFYKNLYENILQRPATSAELHDLANCNSEHSRHHIFRANYQLKQNHPQFGHITSNLDMSMMDLVKSTLMNAQNIDSSVVAFCDNASAIRGCCSQNSGIGLLIPEDSTRLFVFFFFINSKIHSNIYIKAKHDDL